MAPNCRHPLRRAPRLQPGLERPARSAVGSAGVPVLGEGKAASRRKRAFPSHALERALGPGRATPPCPSRRSGKSQSPHTGTRRPQGGALRRAAPTANCHGNPGVRSIPHPAGPPTLPALSPALQPTGLSASRERAIKPKPVPPGNRGGRPTCCGASGADLERPVLFRASGREKPDHAECAESAQAVHWPGLPAAPRPGTGERRSRQVPLVTLPSRAAPARRPGSPRLR